MKEFRYLTRHRVESNVFNPIDSWRKGVILPCVAAHRSQSRPEIRSPNIDVVFVLDAPMRILDLHCHIRHSRHGEDVAAVILDLVLL